MLIQVAEVLEFVNSRKKIATVFGLLGFIGVSKTERGLLRSVYLK